MCENIKPILFNISGPYAVGKDTILNKLMSAFGSRVYRVHTITTRPVSKVADPTYDQLTPNEFKQRISKGKWIVNSQLSGLTAYGTNVEEIEEAAQAGYICIHSVYADPNGAGKLREIFGGRALSIGLLAAEGSAEEQLEALRNRLVGRNRDEAEAIEARLKHQLLPLQYVINNPIVMTDNGPMRAFDHVLINKNLEETVQLIMRLFEQTFYGDNK